MKIEFNFIIILVIQLSLLQNFNDFDYFDCYKLNDRFSIWFVDIAIHFSIIQISININVLFQKKIRNNFEHFYENVCIKSTFFCSKHHKFNISSIYFKRKRQNKNQQIRCFQWEKNNIEKLINANKNLFYFQQRFKRKKNTVCNNFSEKKNKKINETQITKLFERKDKFK